MNADTGTLLWQYQMGDYQGAVVSQKMVYVSSRDHFLYSFSTSDGQIVWKHSFAFPVYQAASLMGNILYINLDQAYALSSIDGATLWQEGFPKIFGTDFTSSVISKGIEYLAVGDGGQQYALYALNASNGVKYWQQAYPFRINPFSIA